MSLIAMEDHCARGCFIHIVITCCYSHPGGDSGRQPGSEKMPDTSSHATAASNDSLAQLPFFKGANPETVAQAASEARWFSVEADRLVFDYGDDSTDIF